MSVSNYHRRRWDEPRIPVEVPVDGAPCCGEVEATRRRDGAPQAFVRCTDEDLEAPNTCSGWFEWDTVRQLSVHDVRTGPVSPST